MDIKTLLEGIEKLLNYMFGGQPPAWLLPTVAWCVGIGFAIWGLAFLLKQIQTIWTEFLQRLFYNPEQQHRIARRRSFADFIEGEMRRLNSSEAWNDNRFAELEAEVEAEGRRKLFDFFKVGISSLSKLYKEKSLSRALERSSERLILVEGDPGSGKSVALRHLAQSMARKAISSNSLKSIIPLYINLKHLRRSPDQLIDFHLIHSFVLNTLKRTNDIEVHRFLIDEDEFQRGWDEGTWLFLLDSFDEIPEILSSTESDHIIRAYAEAISAFLHGMNRCRGVVASREYKGPRFLGWPKFRILPLTMDRKVELIKRTGLKLDAQKAIRDGISRASTDFRHLTGNPMFLSLLCEFMNKKEVPEFPQHTHNIFNDYLWKRLEHDQERLQQRYAKTPGEIRDAAEKLAFCMTADTGIGLSPTLEQLEASMHKLGLSLGTEFSNYVDALAYIKLARLEEPIQDRPKSFTFTHRRFQEYFATAVVLREPERIDAHLLLTDARWRETAVVILQTQPPETITPIFTDINTLLRAGLEALCQTAPGQAEQQPVVLPPYSLGKLGRHLFESFTTSRQKIEQFIGTVERMMEAAQDDQIHLPLDWPKHLFHILGILQEGIATKRELLPEQIQRMIDDLLLFIMKGGSLDDRKWALDIAGCASLEVLEKAIDIGLSSPGAWVKNSAILQVSKLAQIPDKFSKHIISNLLMSAQEELLLKKRYEIYAQFSRFADANYLNTASLIVWMPFVDFFLTFISVMLVLNLVGMASGTIYPVLILLLTIVGVIIRWRSSSILQAILDVYSSRSPADDPRYTLRPSKRLRIKQPKRSDISLVKKLMSLLTGSLFSIAGIVLFAIFILSSRLYILYPYIWLSLILFACLQLWSLIGTFEAFRLRRTSLPWRFVYFFYPLGLSLVFPFALSVYLLDELYLISRAGIGVQVLQKSKIRGRFARFMYWGNYYVELWMPSLLIPTGLVIFIFSNLISTAAVWLVAGFVVLELLILGLIFIKPLMLFIAEWRKFQTAKNSLKRLDLRPLVSIVEELSNRRYRSQLIHSVLEKGYLIPSPTNLSRLRMLIAFIQTSLANESTTQNFRELLKVDRELAVSLGYVNENAYPSSSNWDEDQLDLLCKMSDQLRETISA